MGYDPDKHHRQSIRLKGYDYSPPGYYYVTICTQDRKKLFGEINDAIIRLNDAGQMIDQEWNQIPKRYGCVILDEFVVMPNHFHGILQLISDKNDGNSLFEIIGAFKSITTNQYINCVKQNNWPTFRKRLWQLRYHDRVILRGATAGGTVG